MSTIGADAPRAVAVTEAIQKGDLESLQRLLRETPNLATARLRDDECGASRTLLHVVADWPGHFPNGPAIVAALIEAGADVDAPFIGQHAETPLHWAASSDDVELLDALIDAGADVEAPGAVLGGGTPLADAVGFGQWQAARRLVERGARTIQDRIEEHFRDATPPPPDEVTDAFWQACHGGQRQTAEYLLDRGPTSTGSAGTIEPRSTSPWPRAPMRWSSGLRSRGERPASELR